MQQLNKRFYNEIIPSMKDVTPLASCQLILENARKEIYIANWGPAKDLKRRLILRIADSTSEDCVTMKDLGIEKGEISFQWFIPLKPGSFIVYPLVEEAHLQHAVQLDFNQETWKFIGAKQLASLPKQLMRPTIIQAQLAPNVGGKSLILIGGTE
jgi:hypothetical protein